MEEYTKAENCFQNIDMGKEALLTAINEEEEFWIRKGIELYENQLNKIYIGG